MSSSLELIVFGNPAMDRMHTERGITYMPGGHAMNIAMTYAQLAGPRTVGIIGRIGKDEHGSTLLMRMQSYGVDTSRLHIDDNPTTVNDVTPTNEDRTIDRGRGNFIPVHTLEEADRLYIASSQSVLLDMRSKLFLHALDLTRQIRKSPALRLYSSAHFYHGPSKQSPPPHTGQPGYDLHSAPLHVIIGDYEEMNCVRTYCQIHPDTALVTTLGKDGSRLQDKRRLTCTVKAIPIESKDPTGAGDSFIAGFVYYDIHKKDALCIAGLRFANACGARACLGIGAQQNITLESINHLLTRKGGSQ